MTTIIYLDIYLNGRRQFQIPYNATVLADGSLFAPLHSMERCVERHRPSYHGKPYLIRFSQKKY